MATQSNQSTMSKKAGGCGCLILIIIIISLVASFWGSHSDKKEASSAAERYFKLTLGSSKDIQKDDIKVKIDEMTEIENVPARTGYRASGTLYYQSQAIPIEIEVQENKIDAPEKWVLVGCLKCPISLDTKVQEKLGLYGDKNQ